MAFLSRVLELRKGDVKFPLPIAIHAILFKVIIIFFFEKKI